MLRLTLVALLLVVVAVGCGEAEPEGSKTYAAYPAMDIPAGEPWVIVTTSLGRMTFTLFAEEAPLAVNSFLFLANEGYFDGVTFHRLIPGFMVQGGDPTGTGTGGPGYSFEIEPPQRPYVRGGLAMANKGPGTSNGSQFFIILDDLTAQDRLSPDFTLFGQIKEGHQASFDTLAKIEAVPVGTAADGESSAPRQEITISAMKTGVTLNCSGEGAIGFTCKP
ncbi:MAG: peptidylprolyl isomerase [Chloroflexi bacterium]|nr:peptidylprolyl isomerase [Chloroflexota bacterium]